MNGIRSGGFWPIFAAAMLLVVPMTGAIEGGDFAIRQAVITSGSAQLGAGNLSLSATTGIAIAGRIQGGSFVVTAGTLVPAQAAAELLFRDGFEE